MPGLGRINVRAGPGGPGRSGSRVACRRFRPGSRVAGRGSATPRDAANPGCEGVEGDAGASLPLPPNGGPLEVKMIGARKLEQLLGCAQVTSRSRAQERMVASPAVDTACGWQAC